MTKKQYLQALRERRLLLRERIIMDTVENKFVESSDVRYRERRLINQILRMHRKDEE